MKKKRIKVYLFFVWFKIARSLFPIYHKKIPPAGGKAESIENSLEMY